MEAYIFIFLFLTGSAVRKSESCGTKDSEEKQPLFIDGLNSEKSITVNLLIIGAGAQTVALLARFAEMKPSTTFRIIIVETKSKLGPGAPYDDDAQRNEHLLNFHTFIGIGTASNPNDFLYWLLRHPLQYTLNPTKIAAAPPRRIVFGKYLSQRFKEFVKKCNKRGYDIKWISDTTAQSIDRDGDTGFVIELDSNKQRVRANDVFLATGHFDWSRFGDQDIKGYFKSPWPASDLTDPEKGIPANKDVGIFGSGLTAIDAVLTLATWFGKFKSIKKGYNYTTTYNFKMTMYSRSGHLPAVASLVRDVKLQHLNLDRIFQANSRSISLDDVFQLMKDEAEAMDPTFDEIAGYRHIGYKDFFTRVDNFMYKEESAIGRLEEDINRSKNSPPFETIFVEAATILNAIMHYFLAEDVIAFKKFFVPKISKIIAAMPKDTAEKLIALMKDGYLDVVATGEESNVTARDDNVGVWLQYGTVNKYYRYFIDAVGQSGDMDKDPKPLTDSLLKNNLAQRLCIPFKNDAVGKKAYDEQENKENGKVRPVGQDKYCYISDGVEIHKDTMRVVPPGVSAHTRKLSLTEKPPVPAIYASGPFVYGRLPFAQSLPVVTVSAETVAQDIMTRIGRF